MPLVMCKQVACNRLDIGDGFTSRKRTHLRRRPISTPKRADRRVIFPSLHGHRGARPSPDPHPKPNWGRDYSCRSNNNVAAKDGLKSFRSAPDPFPTLLRANSLDGISIPLPRLSLTEYFKPNEGLSLPMQRPASHISIQSASPSRREALLTRAGPSGFETKPSRSIFAGNTAFLGEAWQHGTYYPAASVPILVHGNKCPPRSRPLTSVLRRGKAPLSSSRSQETSSCAICERPTGAATPNERDNRAPSPQTLHVIYTTRFLPAVPTHASPSLHPIHSDKIDGEDCNGDSNHDLQRLNDFHKTLLRSECKLKCLASKKTITFDARVIVFEFRVTDYEAKGGGKWWTEDELQHFKQGALNRICLRKTRLVPTGTGRFLAVAPTEERGRISPANPSTDNQFRGPVSFNHPALGCDDEFDPGSCSPRKGPAKDVLLLEKYAIANIRNILVVDPHQILLALFTKSLKHMIPHASVATSRSPEGAMRRIEAARKAFPLSDGGAAHGFDILIIEENLKSLPSLQDAGEESTQNGGGIDSGSALIRHLDESRCSLSMSEGCRGSIRHSLMVGVSALPVDRDKLEKSGADCVWGKPPPEMNARLRNKLLGLLMKKRTRTG